MSKTTVPHQTACHGMPRVSTMKPYSTGQMHMASATHMAQMPSGRPRFSGLNHGRDGGGARHAHDAHACALEERG